MNDGKLLIASSFEEKLFIRAVKKASASGFKLPESKSRHKFPWTGYEIYHATHPSLTGYKQIYEHLPKRAR